ncbi:hypothetical protein PEC18_12005 [Paucibacter sp. O1-1]|nr:hypothetical protein [Paucibacter sp. O1-1]MDA3826539.1 hypothetical protein [Paucibacter sp. O1-1]
MEYTRSDAFVTHAPTGQRMHQSTQPVPTAVSANDMNMVVWSLMEVIKDAGFSGVDFDPDNPSTYQVLRNALRASYRDIRSVHEAPWNVRADGSMTMAQMMAALSAAWASALANGHDLYFDAGDYVIQEANFPWRRATPGVLLDCRNVTLWCAGPATVFRTVSVSGADVFQLNSLKNFHVKGFPTLSGTVTGSVHGTNGVSVTNGWDNITLEICGLNLPSLDKGDYVDGGKAFTAQPGSTGNPCGRIQVKVVARGCAEAFGFEPDLVAAAAKRTAIDVEFVAEDCYIGAKLVAAEASGPVAAGITSGVTLRGQSIDCQKDLVAQRIHGLDANVQVVTTKSAVERRKAPGGTAWLADDSLVEALVVAGCKNANVRVSGNKGAATTRPA